MSTDSKWSYDIILRIKQYHDKQWRTSTQQKLMHCDIWAMVYNVLQQRTGQTLWSHQYGHNQYLFNDEEDALAKQAAATHLLQLRPCVLQRPRELAPSGPRKVRPKGNAEGAAEQQSVLASQQEGTRHRPRAPSAHSETRYHSMTSLQMRSPTWVPQNAQLMHPGNGRERDK